jgi:hypothetical protein
MGIQSAGARHRGAIRRMAPTAAAIVASAAACAPAMASSPTIAVSGDSVLATSVPSFGNATIEATRPDALTGAPVVIGLFTGMANPLGPFSVNTTTPTPVNAAGDCWQKGALSLALTPDLQPGDSVTLTQSGLFASGTSTSKSVQVTPADTATPPGPISGCSAIAPWARNAITSGPSTVTDGAITVAGVAQPLATGVSVSATDGTHSTAPVTASLGSDGTWTATIPPAQVTRLDNTNLTVTPVVAVPDVSTGAQAHIAGVGLGVRKSASSDGAGAGRSAGSGQAAKPGRPGASGHGRFPARVHQLRVASSVTLARARSDGLQASFVVPVGATVVRVELLHGAKRLFTAMAPARQGGAVQNVVLFGRRLNRLLRAGRYTIAVQAGTSGSRLGPVTARALRIR